MSTDAGSAAAPEDAATRDVASERPGLESDDPQSADSATSTPESADRGVEGSARPETDDRDTTDTHHDRGTGDRDAGHRDSGDRDSGDTRGGAPDPSEEGFVSSLLRDATVTGLPGETGAPPAEPHAPQAQQQGDEPVGAEPPAGDDPDGADPSAS
jgi:hypothetical protein